MVLTFKVRSSAGGRAVKITPSKDCPEGDWVPVYFPVPGDRLAISIAQEHLELSGFVVTGHIRSVEYMGKLVVIYSTGNANKFGTLWERLITRSDKQWHALYEAAKQ